MWLHAPDTEVLTSDSSTPLKPHKKEPGIPAGVRSLTIWVAALAMAGCAGTGNYPSSPHERNLSIDRNGVVQYSPSHYPNYRDPSENPQLNRTLGGIGIGMLLCKLGGGSWWLALGCGGVGGLIAHSTYDAKEVQARDLQALHRQLIHAYRNGWLSAENRPSNQYITRHVGVERQWMIQGKYHVRFVVREVNPSGQLLQKYIVQTIAISGERQLEFINPVLFPWEKEMSR